MAGNLYVAEDGTIHRHPLNVINNTGNRTNAFTSAPAIECMQAQTGTEYGQIYQVSNARIVFFWIISIIVSILVAVGVNKGLGTDIYGSDANFITLIGPYVIFVGAIAGSVYYGISWAKSVEYNLWAYLLAAASSIVGIITAWIAVAIIYLVLKILFYMLVAGLVIAFIFGIISGG